MKKDKLELASDVIKDVYTQNPDLCFDVIDKILFSEYDIQERKTLWIASVMNSFCESILYHVVEGFAVMDLYDIYDLVSRAKVDNIIKWTPYRGTHIQDWLQPYMRESFMKFNHSEFINVCNRAIIVFRENIDDLTANNSERLFYREEINHLKKILLDRVSTDVKINIDYCPICGKKAIIASKGLARESKCNNGHWWHLDIKTRKIEIGKLNQRGDIL